MSRNDFSCTIQFNKGLDKNLEYYNFFPRCTYFTKKTILNRNYKVLKLLLKYILQSMSIIASFPMLFICIRL